ncbi:MAG: alpha/beta hydrolase family protein [Mycobacteriaceae bacterium]|uniref:alpha/beta hydrolase family protein n=1 Tax=Corynebacterium sp. TaxID=1720 RepID=UPI003F974697
MRHTYAPSIAPDGSAIAYIMHDGYSPRAMQSTLADPSDRERAVSIPTEGPAVAVSYSPDGRWLAVEVSPRGTERNEIWLVANDPEDSSAHLVRDSGDAKTSLVEWDNHMLAIDAVSGDGVAEGRLIDPTTNRTVSIDRRTDGELVAAESGFALMRVGPRANRELLLIRPDGTWRPVLPPQPGSTTDAGHILPPTGGQPPVLLVVGDHGADRRRVMRVRDRGGVMSSRELIGNPDADVDEFLVSGDQQTAAVLWNRDGASTCEILRLDDHQRVTVRRTVQLPGMVASGLSMTGDGSTLALTVESPDVAKSVHIVDCRTGEVTELTGAGGGRTGDTDWSDLPLLGAGQQPQLLHFAARDGVELSGWLYRGAVPEFEPAGGPRPVLLHFHGGPEGQSRPEHHDVLREVIDAGVTVFTPNVRGSFGSGRRFMHADNRYGRFAGINDLEDCVNFLVSMGIADADRMAISGRSYGGYLTNIGVTWFPGLFRAAVSACGMSDLQTFYRDTEPWIASAAYPKYGYPIQDGELLRAVSPLHRADRVRTPMLFIHGANDTNVPPTEFRQMRTALDGQGVPTEELVMVDEGHEFIKAVNRRTIAERMVLFLRRYGVAG